jgi:hypothetical protein
LVLQKLTSPPTPLHLERGFKSPLSKWRGVEGEVIKIAQNSMK